MSLWIWQPSDGLLIRLGNSGIKDPELHSGYAEGILRSEAGRGQIVNRNLDVDGADFVRAGIVWEGWNRTQP